MAKSSGNQIVEEIKNVANIVDVVGDVVTLTKKGANYHGLCPFHNEKTPSFVVSETKQIFTCFGCHASGDVIEFVKKYNNIEFVEALEKLANRYGIKYEKSDRKPEKANKYYEINKEAAIFFYKSLISSKNLSTSNSGISYVKKRNLRPETILKFGIGYADSSWDSLYKHLKSKGYKEDDMVKLGLISYSKGKYFDKFRNRLIFPIFNVRGNVIGFGGRAIGDDSPKYLNSQETYIFSKKNNLYGLNIAKDSIIDENMAILVEGYMDVVSLYQQGVKNAVASLGTALTENQSKLIKRYTKNVTLCYDSDNAGIRAAVRGGEILHKDDINVKVVNVTNGKDPDEFVKAKGKDAFLALIKKGKNYVNYVIDDIKKDFNITKGEEKLQFIRRVGSFLNSLSPAEKDIYIESLADELIMNKETLKLEIDGENKNSTRFLRGEEKEKLPDKSLNISGDILKAEESLLKILIEDNGFVKELNKEFENRQINFKSVLARQIFEIIINEYESKGRLNPVEVMERVEETQVQVLQKILGKKINGSLEGEFFSNLESLERGIINDRLREITDRIAVIEHENDNEKAEKELMRLTLEHRQLLEKIRRSSK